MCIRSDTPLYPIRYEFIDCLLLSSENESSFYNKKPSVGLAQILYILGLTDFLHSFATHVLNRGGKGVRSPVDSQ
jgi:hypothetical protein